jgi:ribosomal protein S18 acetylase RimI-like enzyme
MTRTLTPDDSLAIKKLYDNSFSHLSLYYGQKLGDTFLDRRVFYSPLYGTDCSLVQLSEDKQLKAALLANFKQYPSQHESNYVYLNLLLIAQDSIGLECGKRLLTNFSKIARLSDKSRVITSLQWSGVWPGVLSVDRNTRKVLQSTGGQFTKGGVFAQSSISDLIAICKIKCCPLPSGIRIRPYLDSDLPGLRQLLHHHFSVGWLHETLSKVDHNIENFNGYGLVKTFCPDDVFIVAKGSTVCGFCVVQSVTYDNTSFFGPIGLAPEIRDQGIGHCLMLKAVEYLSNQGKVTTSLWTNESIYRRFYSKLGMKKSMQTHHFEWDLEGN